MTEDDDDILVDPGRNDMDEDTSERLERFVKARVMFDMAALVTF